MKKLSVSALFNVGCLLKEAHLRGDCSPKVTMIHQTCSVGVAGNDERNVMLTSHSARGVTVRGSVTVKQLPSLGWLSMLIEPPWRSTIWAVR